MLTIILALVSLGLYSGAGAIPAVRLVRGSTQPVNKAALLGVGALAALCHGLALYLSVFDTQLLSLGVFSAASVIGWLMAVLTLIANTRQPMENLAMLILPLAGINALLGAAFAGVNGRTPLREDIAAHVYMSMLAYSVLAIAAFQAVLVALQDYKLRRKHPGGFVRLLPPLQAMEEMLFQILRLGFVLLTAALASGFLFLEDMFAQHVAHKTVLSIIAWVVFGTLLLGRWRFGWRGQTAVRWTIGGFIALMLAYFGSKFVLELLLHRQ